MRRVRRKGGNKDKVFGCDLLVHLNASSQEIPQVLRCCSEFVETHGIVDGIYRLSGVSSNIQKLRMEFESDGSPDLNKEVYLQDIHCVSSLCKAYFRELPNPLLTYQLYDKFAEAVSIQLEEEKLVKIRDVLKELPTSHYSTLEFLMRHLVRMASYSSETNMHARNLAIIWAPNLLRSKDIEVSGFNGKAALMEVRVQYIVVEFILTHVPQLFPEQGLPHSGVSHERRTSLPSPSAACNPEEGFLKSTPTQPVPNFGNTSPVEGCLPIRPCHTIIEGTDKRKGSLKGRKWMSIFNIGGRFHDRRHKHSSKEKDTPVLRPARSMDSLSTQSYPKEGSLRATQSPSSTDTPTTSPLVTPSSQSGSDVTVSNSAISGSEYAVTYRRGTGLVSGALGTQGTYTVLDPEGYGVTGNETLQLRSPGLTTKGRRAAMHITGPTMVTVPLHITSNLALGVLQRGGGDRVIHWGRDKDEGDRVRGKEGGEKVKMRESKGMEWKVDDSRKVEKESKNDRGKVTDREDTDTEGNTVERGDGEEEGERRREEEEEKEDVREEWRWKQKMVIRGRGMRREQRAKSLSSSNEEDNNEDDDKDIDGNNEYMDMKGAEPADFQPEVNQCEDVCAFDSSHIFNSTEVEGDDLGLSGYVQDNFDFLDQMDYSAMDHLDCSVPYQVNEFSVEPPCHLDDDYEVMEQAQASYPAELQTHLQPGPEAHTQSQMERNRNQLLSIDSYSRHTKSLSLPHMTSPVHGPEESWSEEEAEDDSDDNDYSSEDDESLFVKSLPTDFFLNSFSRSERDTDTQDNCSPHRDPVHQLQISAGREYQTLSYEFPAWKESTAGDQERGEVKNNTKEDEERKEEKEVTKMEDEDNVCIGKDQPETKSKTTEEDPSVEEDSQNDKKERPSSEASTHFCADYPRPSTDESSTMADITIVEKEAVDNQHSDYPPCHAVSRQKEITDTPFEESSDFSVRSTEQPRTCVREDVDKRDSNEGEDMKVHKVIEDIRQEIVQEITENDQNMWEETTEDGLIAEINQEEKMQDCGKEQDIAICSTSSEICNEHKGVTCEVTEEEESKQVERRGARESVAREEDMIEHVTVGGEEQIAKVSGDETVEVRKVIEDICQEMVLEITENDQNMWEETTEDGLIADINQEEKMQECGKEQDIAIRSTSSEICNEHKGVTCEVTEEEESKQVERRGARESVAREEDMIEHVTVGGEEQIAKVSGDETVEVRKVIEDICQEMVLEITENDQNMWEETTEDGLIADINQEEKMQECGKEQDIAICSTSSEICNEHKGVTCEVTEEEESKQVERRGARESVAREEDMIEHVTVGGEEQIAKVEVDEGRTKETEDRMEVVEESTEANEENLTDTNMRQQCEEKETTLKKTSELAEAIQRKCSISNEAQHHERKDMVSEDKESNEKVSEQRSKQSSVALIRPDMKVVKEGRMHEKSNISQGGVGRKLVISKHPKVYQVKAVPVVPPKPQHCKLTALTLRQQQQQRERGDDDRSKENSAKVSTEHDTVCAGDLGRDGDEGRGKMEKPTLKGGERERERRRDGEERALRDTSRNSPVSMCFDEAVALAAMRREKEKECEKERQREWGNEVQ